MRRVLRGAWAVLVSFYLVLLVILFVVGMAATNTDLRGLALSLMALLLFLAVIFLPICLLTRHWRLALLQIVPIAALALYYGPQFTPRSVAAPSGDTLRVMTYNIQRAENTQDGIAAVIREAGADIVGLQELSLPAADYFESQLADVYPYQSLHPQANAYNGQGVLSRYPIQDSEYWRNPQLEYSFGHMRAEVDVNGAPVVIYNTHPATPVSLAEGFTLNSHSVETMQVFRRARDEIKPVILLGDFNMTNLFPEYGLITAHFKDAFATVGDVGFGFTFPSSGQSLPTPILRLDYIFYNDHLRGVSTHVWPTSGPSDHRPVVAELALAG